MPRTIVLDPDGDVCLRLQDIPEPSDTHDNSEFGDYYEPTEQGDDAYSDDLEQSNDAQGHDLEQADASVTSETDLTLDLIVSSKILATASPPFKIMLYGWSKEGLDLAACKASGTVSLLELPDDNAKAVYRCQDMKKSLLGRSDFWDYRQCLDCLRAGGPPDEERTHTCRIRHVIEGNFGVW
jgi:hypothetical protein